MEDNEDEHQHQQQPSTPFWLQNTTLQSSSRHGLATFSSIIFSSTTVILILLVSAALIFIFFLIPSILNFTSRIFKPNSIKRGWDSLNLVLILFAIICAFLSKTNNNETPKSVSSGRFRSPSSSYKYREPGQLQGYDMYSYSDRMMTRLRSSSSYPDLRQQVDYTTSPISPWISADYFDRSDRVGNVAYRFSDDTQLRSYQLNDSSWQIGTKPSTETVDEIVVEDPKPADILDQPKPTPVPSSSTPPQQQPQLPFNPRTETSATTRVNLKSKRTFRAMERTEEASKESNPTQLQPPRSPTRAAVTVRRRTKRVNRSFDDAAFETRDEEKLQKPTSPLPLPHTAESDLNERKKSGGATKDFLSSFYGNQKRKKKRERQRSSENFEQLLKRPVVPSSSTKITQPPPPPPPPPPSIFQNIFSTKKSKGKKTTSDPSDSITSKSRFPKPMNTTTTKIALTQPPIQTSTTKSTSYNISKGNESPLYGIPEPPPLPPFGMPVWKFVVEGDYVRLKSMNSSRSESPDPEGDSARASSGNEDIMRSEIDYDDEGGNSPVPVSGTAAFCPSPDVNTKADNFIARFRAGLKMEKVNSGKGVGLSKLGPIANINNHN